jgi:uncharacterized membrane protein
MDKAMWDKLAAAGGIIGVALLVIGVVIIGQPPDINADATTVADFFKDNRDQVLWGTFVQGLGVISLIWFIGALGAAMRDAGEGRLAAVMGIAFAITFSVAAVAALTRGALAFSIAEAADPGISLSFYRMGGYLDTTSNLIGSAFFFAVAGAVVRTGLVAKWWGWASGLAGLWHIISSTAWAHDGFWSPDGAGFVSFVVFLVWALVTSILLTMKMHKGGSTTAV